MTDQFGPITLKWDPKNLEIRTMSVEKTLEPLVLQVTTLVNTKGTSRKKKGRSKRAHVLVAAVEKATENFIEVGEQIAFENPDIKQEMLAAVEEVRKTGDAMSIAAREFAEDPCASAKRSNMVRAARNLLSAVTRLLILADMVDVHLLLKSLRVVEDDLEKVKNASSQAELLDNIKVFGRSASELMSQAAKRQQELKDPQLRDDLAAARAILKKHSTMLLTASKVYVRHPELAAAKANRDFVLKQVCEAVNTISDVAQGRSAAMNDNGNQIYDGPGELAAALDDFDERMVMDPLVYNEVRTRPSLEERLESIISGAALMADSSCTRDERRERIVAECNAVRQALQDLLSEYMSNQLQLQRVGKRMSVKETSEGLERAIDHMCRKTRDLRRQLRKAVVDHVSDSFLETSVPLLVLIEAAHSGDEKEVEECALVFTEHANKLVEVANLACSMSNNEDGVKMVRTAAAQIENLCPQVINAARVLAVRPRSKLALDNMDVFRDAWQAQVKLLTEAVDDITTIDDFLAVSESHILEDVNKCVLALQEGSADPLDRTAGAIRGRSARVCNVVAAEMDNYEPGIYTERVLEAIKVLRDQVMPNFAQRVELAVDALSTNPPKEVDENDFIDASRLVYDGVREIRRAVLMNRTDEELDPEDIEFDEHYTVETRSRSSAHTGEPLDEYPDISGITTAREAMRKMTEEDKQKIAQQVEFFRSEKLKFDREVAKWDDTGNDIIVLAKHMCMIMMEMTDFTRGRGPLKTTMDVINAAKKISEAGTKLDKLTRQIADQCPESSTKKDLLAYLQRIALYCHQLNITSKVKADVQNISGELIVSGLDSATSLIQAAKNLMNAVVLTVKSSYVASTKYPRQGADLQKLVVWKMKAPEKKPLVRPEKPEEVRAKVRKGSQKKVQNPIKALSEFQSPTESV
ncbi:catenin alpha isoform X1 [Melanaphis sacchari]|uniref:catenin alpha isoform X1 n=1 Tax=Melanaphis sacchari TaxID=742174 RepID=UPI000DC12DD8|nr:catenin alpha isoform X1 [Melanaphis sacchari]